MKLVLDTSAFWHAPLVSAILLAAKVDATRDGRLEVILPAVAYVERRRQLLRGGQDAQLWRERLDANAVKIEPFGVAEAERVDRQTADDAWWRAHGRDAFIAAHVTQGRTAVTSDAGPVWSSVARLSPDDAAEAILALVAPLD